MVELVKIEERFDKAVLALTIGPAPANIVSAPLMEALTSALDVAEKNKNCKLIILSGEGKHFSYGASVEEHAPAEVGKMLPNFHKLIAKMIAHPVPILGRVQGRCLGGGFEVAMACHFLFTESGAQFAVPEIKLGVFPPPACALLPLKVGDVRANEMIVTGENFSGEDLYRLGMANDCSPSEQVGELDKRIQLFVEKKILPKSGSSIRMATQASRLFMREHFQKYIEKLESFYLKDLMGTQDANEGIMAFIEKRPAVWKNQ